MQFHKVATSASGRGKAQLMPHGVRREHCTLLQARQQLAFHVIAADLAAASQFLAYGVGVLPGFRLRRVLSLRSAALKVTPGTPVANMATEARPPPRECPMKTTLPLPKASTARFANRWLVDIGPLSAPRLVRRWL